MDNLKQALIVARSSSKCGACNKPAFPSERGHYTLAGYGATNGDPGCGVEWKYVVSECVGAGAETATKNLRPDLVYLDGPAWFNASR